TIASPLVLQHDTNFQIGQTGSPASLSLWAFTDANGAAVTVSAGPGGGTLNLSGINANKLAVYSGIVHLGSGAVSRVQELSIDPAAQVDLASGRLMVDYTGSSPAETIRHYLINGRGPSGFGNATWNGTGGITSSTAHASGDGVNLAIGYAENSAL